MRRFASICSSGESQTFGVEGKSGKIQIADTATTRVKAPSTKKSHLQQKNQNNLFSESMGISAQTSKLKNLVCRLGFLKSRTQ
jgi:hypothetical protein